VTFNIVWKFVRGDGNPSSERPTVQEVESTRAGMIARSTPSSSSPPVPWQRGREAALLDQRLIARKGEEAI
jgi:hypothetical protein